jgi:uncharacterized SAM-binding protein YcdF (DUF218 family)
LPKRALLYEKCITGFYSPRMALFIRILKVILIILGTIATLMIILAFTTGPFWIWYKYSTKYAGINRPPEYIVILGGGGMPSETGLIRTWYAAKMASHFSGSRIIISLPGDTIDSLSSVNQMKKEMVLRGIDQTRIILEPQGTNTRAQALQVMKLVDGLKEITNYELRITNYEFNSKLKTQNKSLHLRTDTLVNSSVHQLMSSSAILIVTSPEHLTRAVLTFKKAGFLKVDGVPAFEAAIESDITFNDEILGGRKWIPGVGENLSIRYHFWTQLRYEELMIREFLAIFYYKLKGWV